MIRRLLVLVLLASVTAAAFAGEPAGLAPARRALQEGIDHAKPDDILAARAQFVALQADAPDSPLPGYWIALASWRAEPLLGADKAESARKLLVDGIAACDRAFAADPKFGEVLAVKASLQALSLSFAPQAAMTLGPEMEENFARAKQLEPENPRVWLLHGVYLLHKPAAFGGGPERAQPVLEKAVALFAGAKATARGIDWGRDDACLWLGRCLAQRGDWTGARNRFRDALAANPANGWVRARLLPEAESHVAAPAAPADSTK